MYRTQYQFLQVLRQEKITFLSFEEENAGLDLEMTKKGDGKILDHNLRTRGKTLEPRPATTLLSRTFFSHFPCFQRHCDASMTSNVQGQQMEHLFNHL